MTDQITTPRADAIDHPGGKSVGHICWAQRIECGGELTVNIEFFVRDGHVYRAPMSNPIMPDGFRSGRWECSEQQLDLCKEIIGRSFDKVTWKRGKRVEARRDTP